MDDPVAVLDVAGPYLASRPVEHNLILTLLRARAAAPEPGRYWVATTDEGQVMGVAFHSPAHFPAALTPMPVEAAIALASDMAADDADLPGVGGEAATAASFAGQWAERRRAAARPHSALRLLEARALWPPTGIPGLHRPAAAGERDLLVAWLAALAAEVPPPGPDPERVVDSGLAGGRLWVWDDRGPASVAAETSPVEGVVRIQAVYTPPAQRRRGYATAGVAALTGRVLARGHRCILYADLANPGPNSIYRRIGYRAVAECLGYHFEGGDRRPARR